VQRAQIKITAFLTNAWAQKKMPSRTAMRKGNIEKYPFKVYHIVKPKGNRTMIELKITVDKAVELEQEVKDLYQSIVGTPVKEVENWTTNDVKPAKKEAPKVEDPAPRAVPVKEEAPAPKEEPIEEAPIQAAPSLEATREAVKDVMAKATDKTKAKGEFKAFLDSIGAEKVTSATAEQRIRIMDWVDSRG
jgi:hypothetical protein